MLLATSVDATTLGRWGTVEKADPVPAPPRTLSASETTHWKNIEDRFAQLLSRTARLDRRTARDLVNLIPRGASARHTVVSFETPLGEQGHHVVLDRATTSAQVRFALKGGAAPQNAEIVRGASAAEQVLVTCEQAQGTLYCEVPIRERTPGEEHPAQQIATVKLAQIDPERILHAITLGQTESRTTDEVFMAIYDVDGAAGDGAPTQAVRTQTHANGPLTDVSAHAFAVDLNGNFTDIGAFSDAGDGPDRMLGDGTAALWRAEVAVAATRAFGKGVAYWFIVRTTARPDTAWVTWAGTTASSIRDLSRNEGNAFRPGFVRYTAVMAITE